QRRKLDKRVVHADAAFYLPAIVDKVTSRLDLMLVEPNERKDLRIVNDSGIHSGLDRIVQKDGIEYDPRCRTQPDRHVRDTEDNIRLTHLCAYLLDRIDRLSGIFTILFNAGRDRKGKRIEKDIMSFDTEFRRLLECPTSDLDLILGGSGHSRLVDQADNYARTELFRKLEQPDKTPFAVLIICRIEDRFAACVLKAGLHLFPFGRVEHQRYLDVRYEPFCKLVHIGNSVPAD